MTTDTAPAGLFYKPGNGSGGSKYESIKDGLYKGTLLRFEEGPTFYDTKKITEEHPQGEPQPKIRWVWSVSSVDGTPLNEEISELTSKATGERSFAARFLSAHLGRVFDNKQEDVDAAVAESIGKTVLMSISTKPSGYRKIDVFPATN